MKNIIIFLILIIAAFLMFGNTVAEKVKTGLALLQQGQNHWNGEEMNKARELLLTAEKLSRGNPFCRYHVAFVDYRLAVFHLQSTPDRALPFLTEAESILEKLLLNPDSPLFAEANALYGSCLGTDIVASKGANAMMLGANMQNAFQRALEKGKQNPRVCLLRGINLLFTPAQWGGGADRAMPFLLDAAKYFEKYRSDDPLAPSWGRDEALLYLGIASRQKGDLARAVEYLENALAVNPQNGYARTLLNELKASDGKKK